MPIAPGNRSRPRQPLPRAIPQPSEDQIRQLANELNIDLAEIFRPKRAYPFFGLGHTQVGEKIKAGEIEPPIR
jgi:hypothetical protein